MGEVVTDFLKKNFNKIITSKFTAEIEKEFDRIARGEENWVSILENFYKPFNLKVDYCSKNSQKVDLPKKSSFRRYIGNDHEGNEIFECIGKFGNFLRVGKKLYGIPGSRYLKSWSHRELIGIDLKQALEIIDKKNNESK